jgi:CBS domain-containing membrane protein
MQTPVVDLVQQLIDHRLHHVPVVDEKQRFVGMISPGNLIAALYQHIALERSRS